MRAKITQNHGNRMKSHRWGGIFQGHENRKLPYLEVHPYDLDGVFVVALPMATGINAAGPISPENFIPRPL